MFKRKLLFSVFLLMTLVNIILIQPAFAIEGLSTPAIDKELFREGQVKKITRQIDNWKLICEEIPKLKHKYCSMYNNIKNDQNYIIAQVIVTTKRNGSPGAIIKIPYKSDLKYGIQIDIKHPKNKSKKQKKQTLYFSLLKCDQAGCYTVWNLDAKDIESLHNKDDIIIKYKSFPNINADMDTTLLRYLNGKIIKAKLKTKGFSEAVTESLK